MTISRRSITALLATVLLAASCSATSTSRHADPVGSGSTTLPVAQQGESMLGRTSVRLTAVAVAHIPTAVVSRPGGENLYVTEMAGRVIVLEHQSDDTFKVSATPVIDLTSRVGAFGGERGLLSVAFSPDGTKMVASYTDGNDNGNSVVDMYDMHGDVADPASRVEILRLHQPFPNHNGGNALFGPDGYLWLGYGDGGGQGDPSGNGQNTKVLLAKMLRIDPLHPTATAPYSIPPDNPFADGRNGRPEIWLYGVRNPWRFSFDASTRDLWIADVGGAEEEEIDVLPAAQGQGRGANLGWSLREGAHDTVTGGTRPAGMVEPIFEYDHQEGVAIIGGFVYRGTHLPNLSGAYLYSDYGQSTLRALRVDGTTVKEAVTLTSTGAPPPQIVSFGEDSHHELYAADLGGTIYRLDPA